MDALLTTKFGDEVISLQYAIGSGLHATIHFSLIPEREGGTAGIEHRISWFAARNEFGLTPGHADKSPEEEVNHWGETIRDKDMHDCIGCHMPAVEFVPGISFHDHWIRLRQDRKFASH